MTIPPKDTDSGLCFIGLSGDESGSTRTHGENLTPEEYAAAILKFFGLDEEKKEKKAIEKQTKLS